MTGRSRPTQAGAVDSRSLPVYEAGEFSLPMRISGWNERVAQDTVWAEHAHPAHELLWNEHGASSATVGSRTWTITPTVGLWIPAGLVHTGRAPAGTRYRTALFDFHAFPALADEPVAVEITMLLRLLLDRLAEPSLAEPSRLLTEQIILDVLSPSPDALLVHMPSSPTIRPIAEALDADPGDPRSLGDWSDELGVSTRTITRAFRSDTGLSFTGWQAVLRAQRAISLLANDVPVEDVAELTGYRSASAFGVAFRRTTGLPPGRFRTSAG